MLIKDIQSKLFKLRDEKYRTFQSKLIPTVNPDAIIGVRTPQLRNYAKQLAKEADIQYFLHTLPHQYFDENQLHAFIISQLKDFDYCVDEVCRFLPFVDNWATCDQMSPKVFKKNKSALLKLINEWICSDKTYTVRFAVVTLMEHFLDEDFDVQYHNTVATVQSEEYYINMAIAWYFATALAKQYDATIPFIENQKLNAWTHNKAIQKAVESYRITEDKKEYLKGLKIKIR